MRRKTHTVQQKFAIRHTKMATVHQKSESISEAVLIAEAELASEAARPKPRRNRTSGLMFVLKTSPWRPGDLSWAKMRNGLQKYQCQEPHTQNKMANHQPFCRKATQTIDRFGENAPGRGWRDTKREPFVGNATQNEYRSAEKAQQKQYQN